MRLHIIQPTHFVRAYGRELYKTRKRNLVQLTLPYLAALVPRGIEVRITDEPVQDLNPGLPCDCVFITVTILTSLRAYEIGDLYRKKGIPVVMGGPHCMFYAEEALEHADSVAIGEGETLIPRILEDVASGKLERIYRAEPLHDLANLPFPRRELLDPTTYSRLRTVAVQTTRGCPYLCAFCAERYFLGDKYRMRPVEEVIEEVRRTRSRKIFFADSTFVGNRERTMKLMAALVPLKIRWSTLWNVHRVLDRELMQLARKSGVLHLNMGVESIKPETLETMNKKTTPAERLEEVIGILRDLDISFSFNMIFGWDSDRLEDFRTTLEFLEKHRVQAAFFNVFSPHKGTGLYDQYLAEGRLRDIPNLGRWPGVIAEIQPTNYSAEDLERNVLWMYRKFYSWPSMFRRLPLPRSKASLASWFINLSQRSLFRCEESRTNFDEV